MHIVRVCGQSRGSKFGKKKIHDTTTTVPQAPPTLDSKVTSHLGWSNENRTRSQTKSVKSSPNGTDCLGRGVGGACGTVVVVL